MSPDPPILWAQTIADLRKRVLKTPRADLVCQSPEYFLIDLAAIMGTDQNLADGYRKAPWIEIETSRVFKPEATHLASALDALWIAVRPVLADRLIYHGPITQTPPQKIEDAKHIAALLGIDLDAMFADVSTRKGFTEPKSWAKEEAKGKTK